MNSLLRERVLKFIEEEYLVSPCQIEVRTRVANRQSYSEEHFRNLRITLSLKYKPYTKFCYWKETGREEGVLYSDELPNGFGNLGGTFSLIKKELADNKKLQQKFRERYKEEMMKNGELKQRLFEAEEKYAPGGEAFEEAKKHFESLI
ncbi:hypothetical protein LAU_0087 [Lausannevirus]|uniref:Uncharacterized protein n=1 Tax=Lausannevirus TaxID=999883 RepID=F2WL17_9VIRU|nr:hypothetical protein LAU_0087 [Lausannevirus]AEA06940.1 hypothetical protein LAU_0087 [Lausannevirus]